MLNKLNKRIMVNDFWDYEYLKGVDIDELLDLRDEIDFDSEWVRTYEKTQEYSIDSDVISQINLIRENVFKLIYDVTGSSDLAAYVSDDFDLICKAYIIKLEDKWLASLINVYIQKRIPCGKLETVFADFEELFMKLIS